MATANRANTVINIKIGHIDFESHELKIMTAKNKVQYIIPLSSEYEKILIEYLAYRGGEPDNYLFCSIHGEQLTRDGLKTIIKKYNNSRGVLKTSIHLYRHTFAKKWILNKGDIFRLQKILGHKSIEMVKEYVEMFGNDMQRDFDTFNPLDNLEFMKKDKSTIKMLKKDH